MKGIRGLLQNVPRNVWSIDLPKPEEIEGDGDTGNPKREAADRSPLAPFSWCFYVGNVTEWSDLLPTFRVEKWTFLHPNRTTVLGIFQGQVNSFTLSRMGAQQYSELTEFSWLQLLALGPCCWDLCKKSWWEIRCDPAANCAQGEPLVGAQQKRYSMSYNETLVVDEEWYPHKNFRMEPVASPKRNKTYICNSNGWTRHQ